MPAAPSQCKNFEDASLETIPFPAEESKDNSSAFGSFHFGRSFENITKTYKLINENQRQ